MSQFQIEHPKTAIVCGAGGFIGSHLVKALKKKGYYVAGCDLKYPDFGDTEADEFETIDLRNTKNCDKFIEKRFWMKRPFDELYQLAADMGGAGFVFTGDNDADIMHNSAMINLNVAQACVKHGVKKVFYSSSACIYPKRNQLVQDDPNLAEDTAYPAEPDSDYGWEKIFSERLYKAFERNYGLNVRIARFHNIYGPEGAWEGGREKAPAAMCRKVAMSNGEIEMWGDGTQTRSFLYIDECLEGVFRLMESEHKEPINIGSDEMVTINQLLEIAGNIAGKVFDVNHIDGPVGVLGRNSDNTLIEKVLGWRPTEKLEIGMGKTYKWIAEQVEKKNA